MRIRTETGLVFETRRFGTRGAHHAMLGCGPDAEAECCRVAWAFVRDASGEFGRRNSEQEEQPLIVNRWRWQHEATPIAYLELVLPDCGIEAVT